MSLLPPSIITIRTLDRKGETSPWVSYRSQYKKGNSLGTVELPWNTSICEATNLRVKEAFPRQYSSDPVNNGQRSVGIASLRN